MRALYVLLVACGGHGATAPSDGSPDTTSTSDAAAADAATIDAPAAGFSWQMAGAVVLWNDPITASAATLHQNHFSYVAQYAMNGCANNTAPYSCAANGCTYPGAPSPEIAPTYQDLANWITTWQHAGLYAGAWGVTYNAPEAEAHCMAEIANTLRANYGVTLDLWIVDAEKSYETHKADGYTNRFVDTFDATITYSLAKAEAPECHIDIDYPYWASHGYAIQSQAYWNAYGVNPSYCIAWVDAYGVPKAMNQVMLDGWDTSATSAHPWSAYAADVASAGGVGFSIWRTIAPAAWDQWQALIETYAIASYGL